MSTEEDIDLGTYDFTSTEPFGSGGPPIPHRLPVKMKIDEFTVTEREDDDIPDGNGGTMKAKNALVKGEVVEPEEFKGARRSFFLRFAATDDSDDGKKDARRVMTALESLGYDHDSVKAAGVGIKKSMFVGETLHGLNEHVMKDGKRTYDEFQVVTPSVFLEESARIEANGLPDQTPRQVTSRAAKAAAAKAGGANGTGSALAKGGGAGGKAMQPPSKGKAAGGGLDTSKLKKSLTANA